MHIIYNGKLGITSLKSCWSRRSSSRDLLAFMIEAYRDRMIQDLVRRQDASPPVPTCGALPAPCPTASTSNCAEAHHAGLAKTTSHHITMHQQFLSTCPALRRNEDRVSSATPVNQPKMHLHHAPLEEATAFALWSLRTEWHLTGANLPLYQYVTSDP